MDSRETTRLTATSAESTQHMQLCLRVGDDSLDVVVFSKIEDNSLIYRHFDLEPDENGSTLRHLEDTVYDNPLLLSQFEKTGIIVDTRRFALMPPAVAADNRLAGTILADMFPDAGETETVVNSLPDNAAVATAVSSSLAGFFRRAFDNPAIYCHLTPLIRYFGDRRRHGNTARMFANLRRNAVDILIFGYRTLNLANTVTFRDTADAVYYILAARQALGLTDDSDEILVSGDRDTRMAVIGELRKFIPYVMPVIFPSAMFRAGRDALNAPFDLIVMPLCE